MDPKKNVLSGGIYITFHKGFLPYKYLYRSPKKCLKWRDIQFHKSFLPYKYLYRSQQKCLKWYTKCSKVFVPYKYLYISPKNVLSGDIYIIVKRFLTRCKYIYISQK